MSLVFGVILIIAVSLLATFSTFFIVKRTFSKKKKK